MDQKEFVIGLISDMTEDILGFVSSYRRGGFYHPGDVVQCVKEFEMSCKVFDDEAKAKRALAQYKNYSEAFIYDRASEDYPMPSEKLKKIEVPTHLEVVEVSDEEEPLEGCSVTASDDIESSTKVEQIPEFLESRPYTVFLSSVNSTYNDDILYIAEQHGAIKVKYGEYSPKGNYIPVQNGFWRYAVDSADTLDAILEEINLNKIPLKDPHPSLFETDWSTKYQIRIDDYDKGLRRVHYYHDYKPSSKSD